MKVEVDAFGTLKPAIYGAWNYVAKLWQNRYFFVDNSGNIFLLIENRQEHTTVRLRRMKYSHFVTFVIIAGILIAWKSGNYDRPRLNCWLAHLYTPGFPQDVGINKKHIAGMRDDNGRIMSELPEAKSGEMENILLVYFQIPWQRCSTWHFIKKRIRASLCCKRLRVPAEKVVTNVIFMSC